MAANIVVVHPDQEFTDKSAAILSRAFAVETRSSLWAVDYDRWERWPPDLLIAYAGASCNGIHTLLERLNARMRAATRILLVVPNEAIKQASFVDEIDDFITNPVDFDELAARANALLSRPPTRTQSRRVGVLEFDSAAHAVRANGNILDLSPAELRLMICFLENADRAVSRAQLLQQAWLNPHVHERTVDVNIKRLRAELGKYDCAHMIQTVRGIGYRFSDGGRRDSSADSAGSQDLVS